jgi:poly(hydroxyalkanoate) granule-associated protein
MIGKKGGSLMANPGKIPDFLVNSAQKVFFAGLGAISIAEEKGVRILEELAERGRKYEFRGKDRVEEAGETLARARETAESCKETFEKTLDEKLKKVIGRLGVPSGEEVANLTKRVETLMGSVDMLLRRHEAEESRENGSRDRGPESS